MNAITKEQMGFFSGFLRERSGYELIESKAYLLEARLKSVLNAHKIDTIDALISVLSKQPSGQVTEDVVEVMTINETFFFRDQTFFDTIEQDILPGLAAANRGRRTRIWSAACSTGQEPYSVAMIFEENRYKYPDFQYEIIASDISNRVLDKAREGIFTNMEANRGLPPRYRDKYFKQNGSSWVISDAIKQKVQFRRHNLKDDFTGLGVFDFILLRNVLIYFDAELKEKILSKIEKTLNKDGYMMLGAAEGIHDPRHYFVRSDRIKGVFRHREVQH